MSHPTHNSVTRRKLLVAGGTGAAAALALSAAGPLGRAAEGGADGRLVALGCCPVEETALDAAGRVYDAARIAGSLPRVGGGFAQISLLGFHPVRGPVDAPDACRARDFGDFARSTLRVHFELTPGDERPVHFWFCDAEPVANVGGPSDMRVATGPGDVVPFSLQGSRSPPPLVRRVRAAAGSDSEEDGGRQRFVEPLAIPQRRGIFFVAGRLAGSGRLPSWGDCRVRTSPTDGALILETHGLGPSRPVDFPYLVIRLDHVATPSEIAIG